MLSFGSQDRGLYVKAQVTQLTGLIRLAQNESLRRNREWGVHFEKQIYRFSEYDPIAQTWTSIVRRPFSATQLKEDAYFKVTAETYQLNSGGVFDGEGVGEDKEDDEVDLPTIIIYSSGEHTPFTINVFSRTDELSWQITSNGLLVQMSDNA